MSEMHVPVFVPPGSQQIGSIPPEALPDYFQAHPEEAKRFVDSTAQMAEIAAKLHQWEAMQQAIKVLLVCQQAVLDWWENNVLRRGQQISRDLGRFATPKAEKVIGFSDSVISRWRSALRDPASYEQDLATHIRRKAGLESEPNRVTPNSGEHEWFTPAQYIEAARQVMGGIDLDPATHEVAQQTVQAAQYFTAADDGLAQPWHGRVWLNPPYETGLVDKFAAKLLAELAVGHTTEAILLTNNCTDTRWFHSVAYVARLLCFTLGRIRFVGLDGELGQAPLQGQTFFYFGPNADHFSDIFGAFGFVR